MLTNPRLLSLARQLRRDEQGAVVVEFAFWIVGFFFVAMIAIDFGFYFVQRTKLNMAVGSVAVAAFNTPTNVDFANMPSAVQSLGGLSTIAVTVSCNGTANSCVNSSRTCACLKTDGTYVATACGATCTGTGVTAGSTAGYYMTVRASVAYRPMVIPTPLLTSSAMDQQATVRLQ
jgi:Flp pilus assembly protein TadG